jgi:hypothetical protein
MSPPNMTKARANAKKIGVEIKPSTVKNKKIDIFKNNEKVASIGHIDYDDFTQHKDPARRKNYLARHAKTRVKVNSPSWMLGRFYGNKCI